MIDHSDQNQPLAAGLDIGGAASQVEAPAPPPVSTRVHRRATAVRSRDGAWLGTGRRKAAIARVQLRPGDGKFLINGRDLEKYFAEDRDRAAAVAPLIVTNSRGAWNISVNVYGGGTTGQAGAVLLGVARALVHANVENEPALRDAKLLTRDARIVERKKPGRKKARRSFQFSKR